MTIFQNTVLCSLVLSASTALAGTWTPDPSLPNPQQHVKLYEIGRKYAEANFDADANLVGSNSKHPPNRRQHSTRESASFAYGLLLTGDPADAARAQPILRRVCATQETNMALPTGGAFGWYAEDLQPNDLNSAAFMGAVLVQVIDLDRRKPCLEPHTRELVVAAAKLAVRGIMKRNVDADYTNMALLSSAVAAAGDKLLSVPGAGQWAEDKIDAVIKNTGDGEFTEYLSPTYYAVDVSAVYLARKYSFSDAFAGKIDSLTDHLWKQIALAYHSPTYQLGGPFSRCYGNDMLTYAAALKYDLYLALNGAYPLPDTDRDHDWDKAGLMSMADQPIPVRPEFQQVPPAWRKWTAAMPHGAPRTLRQFRQGNFILGTVGLQDEWKQKRNLVAFWRTDDATAPDGFRVGYCYDQTNESLPGKFPPAKMHFYCDQVKGSALVALMTPLPPPEDQGAQRFVFAPTAKLAGDANSSPLQVNDGTMTTWIYPLLNDGKATYTSQSDAHVMQLNRLWTTADQVGSMHVIAYLIVFRPADQGKPAVENLKLQGDGDAGTASAQVDGQPLTVSFKKTD
jgi:hypothetical protein